MHIVNTIYFGNTNNMSSFASSAFGVIEYDFVFRPNIDRIMIPSIVIITLTNNSEFHE